MTKNKPEEEQPPRPQLRNAPLHIPLPFEKIVDAMLQTPPLKKPEKPKKKSTGK